MPGRGVVVPQTVITALDAVIPPGPSIPQSQGNTTQNKIARHGTRSLASASDFVTTGPPTLFGFPAGTGDTEPGETTRLLASGQRLRVEAGGDGVWERRNCTRSYRNS